MKISEIIVESRSQLDEGMMDIIKSKLSGVYQMARKKYPNFDEVFAIAKSHKAEINGIIEQLKMKKETGKLSKEDVVAAIMPLSKKIAGEVGGKGVINEDDERAPKFAVVGAILGGGVSIVTYIIINLFTNFNIEFLPTLFVCVSLLSVLFAFWGHSDDKRRSKLSPEEREFEDLRNISDTEEEKQYFAHLDINGTETAQERDDYNRLYQKYGEYVIKRPGEMSHVEREKYAQKYEYRQKKLKLLASKIKDQKTNGRTGSNAIDYSDEFKRLKEKFASGTGTKNDRDRYDDLYLKGYR